MARVLIVDDSDFIRVVIRKYLEKNDHEIVGEAKDGKEAVSLYKELKPDIVTLDVIMETGGMEALEEILDFDKKANVIICSSIASPLNITKAIKLGAKCYILKPISGEALNRAISDILRQRKDDECACLGLEKKELFLMSMFNDTMKDLGIHQHDILFIDKDSTPSDSDMVLTLYGDYLGFARYSKKSTGEISVTLKNTCAVKINESEAEIVGTVKGLIRLFNGKQLLSIN